MDFLTSKISAFFIWVLDSTLHASMLIILILAIKAVAGKRLPTWWHYCLWLLLLVRMIMPWAPGSEISVFNIVPVHLEQRTMAYFNQNNHEVAIVIAEISSNESWNWPYSKAAVVFALPGVWFAGVVLFGIFILYENLGLWIHIKRKRPITDQGILDLLEDCKAQMKIHTVLGVVVTDKIKSPALFGYIRPRLLLPQGMVEKIGLKELGYVFLHELGHLKRHDIGICWLMTVLQVVHWFNPLVWFAFYQMRIDQESSCDAFVLSRLKPDESAKYANAIISFLEKFCRNRQMPALAGVLENKSQMKRRINMIVNFRKHSYKLSAVSVFLIVIFCCTFFTNALDSSDPNAATPSDEKTAAFTAANIWLELVDNEKYAESWNEAAGFFKNAISMEKWQQTLQTVRKPMGGKKSRELIYSVYKTSLPGAPSGKYFVLQFKSSFENKKSVIETITPMFDNDGKWRVSGYYIK